MNPMLSFGVGILIGIVGFVVLYHLEQVIGIDQCNFTTQGAVSLLSWQFIVVAAAWTATGNMYGPLGVVTDFLVFMLINFYLNTPAGKEWMESLDKQEESNDKQTKA